MIWLVRNEKLTTFTKNERVQNYPDDYKSLNCIKGPWSITKQTNLHQIIERNLHVMWPPHLPNVEDLLRTDDGLRAQFTDRHQTLDVVVKTNDATEAFDADDVALGNAAGPSIVEGEEQRQGAFHQGLLSGQVQLLSHWIHWQHLKKEIHQQTHSRVRKRVNLKPVCYRLYSFILKKNSRTALTRHLTFMPSMYFFSGFFRRMSDRWVRGTRPLIWSDRCTTIPWVSRTDTFPLRGQHREE